MDEYTGSNGTYNLGGQARPMSLMESPVKINKKSYKLPPKQNHIAAKGQVIINSLDTDKIVFSQDQRVDRAAELPTAPE